MHRVSSPASTPNRRDSGLYSQSFAQVSEAIASRLEGREETAEIVGDPKVAVNAAEDASRLANEEQPSSSPSPPSPPSQIQAINETETVEQQAAPETARKDDVAPAVQEESDDSTPVEPDELPSPEETLAPRNTQSALYNARSMLSVAPLRDASAAVHRKLKMLFCSWKFYFCIFSVVIAYLVQLGRPSYLLHTLAITPASI